MGFHPLPIGIFNDIPDEIMEEHLCGEVYDDFDGREPFKMRCTRFKGHSGEHGWISDEEFKLLKKHSERTLS